MFVLRCVYAGKGVLSRVLLSQRPLSGPEEEARLDLLGRIESGRHLQRRAKVILVFYRYITGCMLCLH